MNMKIGIVGNGGIVKEALKALKNQKIAVTALWCRNREHGKPLTDAYGIPSLYTDYDAFLQDDSFDTVYIGLINSLHYEYALKALQAKKHVIVEKPLSSSYEQGMKLMEAAEENGVMLFEAVMSRYSENYTAILMHLDEIGAPKLILSNYSQYSRRYDAYKEGKVLPAFDPGCSGGSLYDLNVYNVHFITGIFGGPKFAWYTANKGFNGIDTSGVLIMDYGNMKAVCTAAKDSASPSGTIIQGEEGYIIVRSRPGYVRNITLHKDKENTDEILDVKQEDNPMEQEFHKIQNTIDRHQDGIAAGWMNHSLQAMMVLDNARKDVDLEFPGDMTKD